MWQVVEQAAHDAARRFGYQEIEVPAIEPVELIERGVGGDTDVVRIGGGETKAERLAAVRAAFPFTRAVEAWFPNNKRNWTWDDHGNP